MPTSVEIQNAVERLTADIALLHDIIQGDSLTDVSTEGGIVPSVSKFYNQLLAAFAVGNFPGVIRSDHITVSADYTVTTADTGKTINVSGGGNFHISFADPSGYSDPMTALVINRMNNRCQFVDVLGDYRSPIRLWPGHSVLVQKSGAAWAVFKNPLERWNSRLVGGFIYVNAGTGSDLNDGLDPSAPLEFAQTALDLCQFEMDCPLGIQLAPGTYGCKPGLTSVMRFTGPPIGADLISVQGDTTGSGQGAYILLCPASGTCIDCQDGAVAIATGLTFMTAGNASTLVSSRQQAVVDTFGCDVGAAPLGAHFNCTTAASINILNNAGNPICMNVLGSASFHVGCNSGSYVNYGSFIVNIPSPLAMGQWFLASDTGVIGGGPMTYSGAGYPGTTGQRYVSAWNAVIHSNNPGEPGNVAGVTQTGGQYT